MAINGPKDFTCNNCISLAPALNRFDPVAFAASRDLQVDQHTFPHPESLATGNCSMEDRIGFSPWAEACQFSV